MSPPLKALAPILSSLLAIACGPSSPVEFVDAAGQADSGPLADAAPRISTMYVHTPDTLYVVDDQNFDLQEVGPFAAGEDITDLAVNRDGEIYGISTDALYVINDLTGEASYVADVPGVVNVGLTFLDNGTLLATDKEGGVRQIDITDGSVTEVGSFGGGYATAGDLVAVADGTMYAISDDGPNGDEVTNNVLLTVNTSTGVATPVGQIGYGRVFGCSVANNKVYAFTDQGEIIEIAANTGIGTLRRDYTVQFWGAGVTPLAVID